MALDAAHRASIPEKLRPVLGDEDANVLMSQFPSVEAHELVTKDFLRAELAELSAQHGADLASLRAEVGADVASLRAEVGADVASLRVDHGGELVSVRADIASLRADVAEMKSVLTVRMGSAIAASTALLAAVGIFT